MHCFFNHHSIKIARFDKSNCSIAIRKAHLFSGIIHHKKAIKIEISGLLV
jgi:hypothetical protein